MEPKPSQEIARITAIETGVERTGTDSELAYYAPAAAAALRLLADAIKHGSNHDDIVQALKDAGVHHAFADVLDAASEATMNALEDPYEFDGRLIADNLAGAAGQVRDAFRWL
ncbi:hypothetical protein [Streptomyces sp. HUAS TT7]|uniref:hypothetical protein n=1 Tax=Streptomyces sp. HUAS TT7 TaxID=3447507 RepID=UPI003F65746D